MVMSQKLEDMVKVKHVQSNSELHCIMQKNKKKTTLLFWQIIKMTDLNKK